MRYGAEERDGDDRHREGERDAGEERELPGPVDEGGLVEFLGQGIEKSF